MLASEFQSPSPAAQCLDEIRKPLPLGLSDCNLVIKSSMASTYVTSFFPVLHISPIFIIRPLRAGGWANIEMA